MYCKSSFYNRVIVLVKKGRVTDIIYLDSGKAYGAVTHDSLV